jgi:hypothetical protein
MFTEESFLKIFILLFVLFNCHGEDRRTKLVSILFEKETTARPELLFSREIDLNSKEGKEEVLIVRNIQEEILAVFSFENSEPKIEYNFRFTSPSYGPFQYSWKEKVWQPAPYSLEKEAYLIQNMEFFKLTGDNFYSIFLEILSQEPPLPIFSVPMIYREGKLIFDGLEILKNEKFLSKNLKTSFQYNEKDAKLNIISPTGEIEKVFYYKDRKFNTSNL